MSIENAQGENDDEARQSVNQSSGYTNGRMVGERRASVVQPEYLTLYASTGSTPPHGINAGRMGMNLSSISSGSTIHANLSIQTHSGSYVEIGNVESLPRVTNRYTRPLPNVPAERRVGKRMIIVVVALIAVIAVAAVAPWLIVLRNARNASNDGPFSQNCSGLRGGQCVVTPSPCIGKVCTCPDSAFFDEKTNICQEPELYMVKSKDAPQTNEPLTINCSLLMKDWNHLIVVKESETSSSCLGGNGLVEIRKTRSGFKNNTHPDITATLQLQNNIATVALHFDHIDCRADGVYKCFATNSINICESNLSSNVSLLVTSSPTTPSIPKVSSGSYSLIHTHRYSVTCEGLMGRQMDGHPVAELSLLVENPNSKNSSTYKDASTGKDQCQTRQALTLSFTAQKSWHEVIMTCVATLADGNKLQSPSIKITVNESCEAAEVPSIFLSEQIVEGMSTWQDKMFHCNAQLGNSHRTLDIESNISGNFTSMLTGNHALGYIYRDVPSADCGYKITRFFEFSGKIKKSLNGTKLRCVVRPGPEDDFSSLISEEKVIHVVPANHCSGVEFVNLPHVFFCSLYVYCRDRENVGRVNKCLDGKCFSPISKNCTTCDQAGCTLEQDALFEK